MTVCAPTVVTSLGSRGTLPHQASVNRVGMPVPQSVMNARSWRQPMDNDLKRVVMLAVIIIVVVAALMLIGTR